MSCRLGIAAFLALALAAPASAAPAPSGGAIVLAQAQTPALGEETSAKRKSRKRDGASKREPSINQMAARERQRKCAAEWKSAKAADKTEGLKWPKYWSQCNARLKGKTV
jgi:parvulin-like peptidyl-prolyl isomerase